jgi:hypothetical protein
MATFGISLSVDQTELRELQTALGKVFTNSEKTQILKRALEKAVAPVLARLKQLTPLGPTGNLQRAATSKVIGYSRSGNAVALVGFRRAAKEKFATLAGGTVGFGPDRAFHQWFLEKGTKERLTNSPSPPRTYNRSGHNKSGFERSGYQMTRNGKTFRVSAHSVSGHAVSSHSVKDPNAYYYASSFKRLGPFKIRKFGGGEKGFITDPAYPNAFFKKSKDPIRIPAMPVGGSTGQPPLQTAWDQTQSTAAEILQRELRISLEDALDALTRSATGSVDL